MKISDNRIASLIRYYKTALNSLYPEEEINSIIQLVFYKKLGLSRIDLVLKKEDHLSESEILQLHFTLKRLKQMEPVQYVLGEADFQGMIFKVGPEVLIPRPETEELVQAVAKGASNTSPVIFDIGTGSGCIAIALKKLLPYAMIYAIDISTKALTIAAMNAEHNEVEVTFLEKDILSDNLSDIAQPDIIVSNPPYIPISEKESMDKNVTDHEPEIALFVKNETPFVFYDKIAAAGQTILASGGQLFFEIHENFGSKLVALLSSYGYRNIKLLKDVNNKERILKAEK